MERHLGIVLLPARLSALMLSVFAGLALLLASVGLYGIVSYAVSQRTHEMGIRMSLGADASAVIRMLTGSGMKLVAVGGLLGLVLALLVTLVVVRSLQLGAWAVLGDLVAADAGLAATMLTAVLAIVVVGLAWAAQRGSQPELGWLVYPLIALGGLKLLLQDVPHGRPATLVVSLALYGAVLILAPRFRRPREE